MTKLSRGVSYPIGNLLVITGPKSGKNGIKTSQSASRVHALYANTVAGHKVARDACLLSSALRVNRIFVLE